jgi:hypothetical protein
MIVLLFKSTKTCLLDAATQIKGSLIRDFRLQVVVHESVSPGPLSIQEGPLQIFTKIQGDIRNFVFFAGVNNTGDKLFACVNDTAINYYWCCCYWRLRHRR